MAKALFGHIGQATEAKLGAEVRRLRDRVHQLEDEVAALRAANTELADAVRVHDGMLAISVPDSVAEAAPALT